MGSCKFSLFDCCIVSSPDAIVTEPCVPRNNDRKVEAAGQRTGPLSLRMSLGGS